MSIRKAIILDRDGTLIEDKDYAYKIEDLKLLPGVIEGLKFLQQDYLFFIVTNQSGIGRGYYSESDFFQFNNHLIKVLEENQIRIEETFYCPHIKEENCECRKPKIKYIKKIVDDWNISIKDSWMMGDHPSDIQFGINGGCKTVYMITGHGKKHLRDLKANGIIPTLVHSNFLEAVEEIRKLDI
ncbi:MAG: HAD-IIIA family hydrolase [Promethearchaeota archaeon]|nr:MAG: HAD-IIIA family hydrolase [Candidatus Lokiarchaeota archaeon]